MIYVLKLMYKKRIFRSNCIYTKKTKYFLKGGGEFVFKKKYFVFIFKKFLNF